MSRPPADNTSLFQSVRTHVILPPHLFAHGRTTPFQAVENRQRGSEASDRDGSTHSLAGDRCPRAGASDEGILRPTSLCTWHFDHYRGHLHIAISMRRVSQYAWDLEQRPGRGLENNHRRSPPQRQLYILSTVCNGPCCGC